MIDFALRTHLAGQSALVASIAGRVYVETADQQRGREYVVLRLISGGDRVYHTLGASGLVEALILVTCYADDYPAARDLYELVRDAIDGYRGQWDTTQIDSAKLSTPYSVTEAPIHGDEVGAPAVQGTLNVFYYESVPDLLP